MYLHERMRGGRLTGSITGADCRIAPLHGSRGAVAEVLPLVLLDEACDRGKLEAGALGGLPDMQHLRRAQVAATG